MILVVLVVDWVAVVAGDGVEDGTLVGGGVMVGVVGVSAVSVNILSSNQVSSINSFVGKGISTAS